MSQAKTSSGNKHQAAIQAAQRTRTRNIIITVAVIVALALIITPLAMYANGSIYRVRKVATVGDESFSVADYNYFFSTAYMSTYQSYYSIYGDYTSYIIDTSTALDEQQYNESQTWADHFSEQALTNMQTAAMLCSEAKSAGFTLSEEQQAELDSIIDSLATTASQYGYTSSGYLSAAYGSGVTQDVFERCMTMSYTADAYSDSVLDGMTYTADELQAQYDADPTAYDTVTFHLFLVPAAAEGDESTEDAMAAAKAKADEMAANVTDTQSFGAYTRELCSEDSLSDYESDDATIQHYIRYSSVQSYEYGSWLFEDGRTAGDTMVVEASSGYQVVMFLSREDLHYNLVSVRHILVQPETDEETGEATDETWEAARETAEAILAEYKAGEQTEDAFSALGDTKAAESDSISSNGYSNVHKGQMVSAFNDWCFAGHSAGDTGIVKTSYGYHVMYFVGEGEEYWTQTITEELQSEAYSAWQSEKLELYPITTNSSALRMGRHS